VAGEEVVVVVVIVYNNMPFVACRMSTLRAAMNCELIGDVGIGVNKLAAGGTITDIQPFKRPWKL